MTPEEARAELARMDSLEGNNEGITPEEAQAMLATMPKPKTTLDLGVGEEGQYDFSPKPIPQTALPKPIPPSDTIREDGTPKADGFLGPLKRPDGQVSTEISIGVFFDGKERLIPSLVPGLTESEIGSLLVDGEITKAIQKKAVAHARMRIKQGLSPFKEVGETPYKNVNAKKNTFAENWNQAASAESEMMSRPENLAGAAGVSGTIAAAIPALTAVGLTQITGIAAEKAKKLGLFNSDTDYMDAANYVSSEIARQIIPGGIEGAKASAGAMVPFEKWSEMANAASESEFKRTGNALWATAVLTALEAVPYGLGYGVAKGAIKGVPKVVKGLETHITAGPKELRMAAWQKAGYDVPVASGEVIAPNLYPSSVVRSLNALTPNKAPDTKAFITPEGAVIYIEKGEGVYTPMSNTLDGTPMPIKHTALRPSKDLKKVQYEMDKFVAKTNYSEAPSIIKVNTPPPEQPVGRPVPEGKPIPQGKPVPEAPLESRVPIPPEIKTPASAKYETVDDILNSDSPAASTYRWMEGGIIDTLKRENFWDTFAREAIDVSEPAKRRLRKLGPAGVKAEMRRDFIIHAPTSAAQIFKDVSPLIYEGLNIKEAKALDRLIFSKRVIEIDSYKIGHKHPTEPKFRGPKGDQSLTGLDHLVQIDEINRLEPGLRDSLHQRANVYFQTMREHIVEPLYREGLLNDNQYAALASHIYEPRKMLEHVDPGFMSSGGKTITSPDSGIKRLKEGTLEAMELDSQLLLGDALARTQGRIFTNRANKALYEIAVNDPIFTGAEIVPGKKPEGNGIVRLLKGEESPRPGHNVVTVMVEGKQHRLELPNEVYNDWVVSDPIFNRATAEVLGWATGTKILKSMATGYNPAFAMTNLPRDMLHILMTTNEYSSFLPVGIKQLVGDLRATRKDAWHTQRVGGKLERTGEFFKQYQREGGMGEYFTHQGGGGYGTPGRFLGEGRHVSDSLEGVKKFLGYIGESSEIWTRLAVKRRAMLNGKNAEESTWAANNYLDFLQGGHTSKALDSLLPYFGAGVQGSRGIFRAWKRNPVLSAWKAAQLMTASTLLAMANYAWNPKAMSNVETKERTGNFIVTTPFSFFDKNGNERDNYLKVAKDQAQRVFATIAEAIVARVFEGRKPGPEIYDAIGALIPITPDKFFPPVWSAWLALHADIDLYTNDEVWPSEQEIYDYLKYTNTTNPAWVKLGELSKDLLGEKNSISPINFERGAMKILTAGNPYTDVVGAGLRQLMDGDKTGQTYAGINEELVNNATLRRIMNATPGVPRQDRQDIKDAMIATASAQKIQNRALQLILEKKGTDLFALNKAFREYINTQPRYDRKRLETRIKRLQRGLDIPNINTWLSRAELEPHSRAVNLLLVLKNTPEDKKGEILSIAHRVPEYWSEDFAEQWSMVRAETGY